MRCPLTRACLVGLALAARPAAAEVARRPAEVPTATELGTAFGTRTLWTVTAAQAPPIADPTGVDDGEVPGEVTICLRRAGEAACDPQLQGALRPPILEHAGETDFFAEPHFLEDIRILRPHGPGGAPLLLVQTASLHSGDGDQLVRVQALTYLPARDRFVRVYDHLTGRNNNQEVRYIDAGPLRGDIVSAEPTDDAPFGYWVVVNAPSAVSDPYRPVLRFRSATHYGDENPLPVIDSEMPNILRRLGLWSPGGPLPLPPGGCPKPHLVRTALWCG